MNFLNPENLTPQKNNQIPKPDQNPEEEIEIIKDERSLEDRLDSIERNLIQTINTFKEKLEKKKHELENEKNTLRKKENIIKIKNIIDKINQRIGELDEILNNFKTGRGGLNSIKDENERYKSKDQFIQTWQTVLRELVNKLESEQFFQQNYY